MSTLTQAIFAAAQSLPDGGILSPKEFLHLGSRAAVDQALTRLTRESNPDALARRLSHTLGLTPNSETHTRRTER